jgi:hypothetical protein
MGIKFLCPNGHKLNVKSFLSGQRAICPKCGARLLVPTPEEAAAARAASGLMTAVSAGPLPAGGDTDVDLASPGTLSGSDSTTPTDSSAAPPAPVRRASAVDAIAEAPEAVWYVRPATGGQFGPAAAEVMRGWLNEGRVGASSLVWRAGWPEWRAAAAVFPQLGGLAVPTPNIQGATTASIPPIQIGSVPLGNGPTALGGGLPHGQMVQSSVAGPPAASATLSSPMPPLAQSAAKRRRQHDRRLLASALLIVASIILLIALVIVFRRQSQPATSTTQEAPPMSEPTSD